MEAGAENDKHSTERHSLSLGLKGELTAFKGVDVGWESGWYGGRWVGERVVWREVGRAEAFLLDMLAWRYLRQVCVRTRSSH